MLVRAEKSYTMICIEMGVFFLEVEWDLEKYVQDNFYPGWGILYNLYRNQKHKTQTHNTSSNAVKISLYTRYIISFL